MTTAQHPALDQARATRLLDQPVLRRTTTVTDFDQCAAAVATWFVEVQDGRRAPEQLLALLAPPVRARLRQRRGRHPDPARLAPVVRTTTQQPTANRIEAVALVRRQRRVTAITITFERRDGRWLVTELCGPEDAAARRGADVAPVAPDVEADAITDGTTDD